MTPQKYIESPLSDSIYQYQIKLEMSTKTFIDLVLLCACLTVYEISNKIPGISGFYSEKWVGKQKLHT